jgi:CheY-like chemotaxis protein
LQSSLAVDLALHTPSHREVNMLYMPKKVLIADNDISILSVLPRHFSELGYSVRSAEDGSSALSEIEKELPDILLSDLKMPGIPGTPFLVTVRQNFPSIRVVAMSGVHSGSRVPRGVAADAFYEKGSSLHLLTETVDAMTRPGRLTIRLATEDWFGFTVFEKIPSHPDTGQLVHSAEHTIAFLVPQRSEGLKQSQRKEELPSIRREAIVERHDGNRP